MNKIKKILFILLLLIFIVLLVISLLLPNRVYENLSDRLFEGSSDTATTTAQNKPKPPELRRTPTTEKKDKTTTPNQDASIEVVEGFDWRLPRYAKRSQLSGLISESRGSDDYIRADFHMVRWDKTNPQQNRYDFNQLESSLRSRPQQQVLLRLETYGRCEAPEWVKQQLRFTSRGTIIFWQDEYLQVLRPYISEVAKLVNRYPQIVGVQIGISDGQYRAGCEFAQKDGWGEFNLKPEELKDAQDQYGLTPHKLERYTKRIIDLYADEFAGNTHKLVFNNFDQFSWMDIAIPYNNKMTTIAKYALDRGIGNRDGQIEHWMRYTRKIYGMELVASSNQTCALDMNEGLAKRYANRYWGTENEEFGDYYWVRDVYGSVGNQAHRFFASSLRTLQMRRNYMTINGEAMKKAIDPVYKTQDFLHYLDKTLGKKMTDTPDAFVLLGERYIANFRLNEYPQRQQCQIKGAAAVRSFGRWITEKSDSTPAMRIVLPASDKRWGQGFYLPENIDYEYAARSSKQFSFDVNDELIQKRCPTGCDVEIKLSYQDGDISNLWIESANLRTGALRTAGDGRIKTATFKLQSAFSSTAEQDFLIRSDAADLKLILMRINFLTP